MLTNSENIFILQTSLFDCSPNGVTLRETKKTEVFPSIHLPTHLSLLFLAAASIRDKVLKHNEIFCLHIDPLLGFLIGFQRES